MAAGWIEKVVGSLDDKKRWRAYKARVRQLPPNYRATVDAIERYLMYRGAVTDGNILMKMNEDLLDLFEQSAASGTPIREIVGDDPAEFVETFLQNYSEGQWIKKERERMTRAIESVERDEEKR